MMSLYWNALLCSSTLLPNLLLTRLVVLFLACVIRINIKFIYLILVVVLRWFIDEEVVNAALSGNIIEEEVEVKLEQVPASCLDKNVCLESC